MKKHIHGWHVYLAITFVLLGLLISTQIQTQNRLMSDLPLQSTSDLSIMLKNLTDKRRQLTQAIDEAEDNLITYQNDYRSDSELITRMDNEVNRLALTNGTVAVQGPGIEIAVDGNLLASDLVILINELWAAGAEAVAVNDYRVTATTGISYVETQSKTYLTCDGNLIQTPITIRAIGSSSILEKSLTMPGGIVDNLSLYQIRLTVSLQDEISLQPVASLPRLRYAQVPEK